MVLNAYIPQQHYMCLFYTSVCLLFGEMRVIYTVEVKLYFLADGVLFSPATAFPESNPAKEVFVRTSSTCLQRGILCWIVCVKCWPHKLGAPTGVFISFARNGVGRDRLGGRGNLGGEVKQRMWIL
jgi:hypothetical protein